MKKIMFNDKYGLTQAVLEGRKTMTRRVIPERIMQAAVDACEPLYLCDDITAEMIDAETDKELLSMSPYKVGEVVAVAQSYKDTGNYPESYIIDEFHPNIEFEAGWNNKMFVRADLMIHEVRITNIKVERLQDISDADCEKEGIDYVGGYSDSYYFGHGVKTYYKNNMGWLRLGNSPREAFAALIDKVSGKGTWESNPYVFVYEFELVK